MTWYVLHSQAVMASISVHPSNSIYHFKSRKYKWFIIQIVFIMWFAMYIMHIGEFCLHLRMGVSRSTSFYCIAVWSPQRHQLRIKGQHQWIKCWSYLTTGKHFSLAALIFAVMEDICTILTEIKWKHNICIAFPEISTILSRAVEAYWPYESRWQDQKSSTNLAFQVSFSLSSTHPHTKRFYPLGCKWRDIHWCHSSSYWNIWWIYSYTVIIISLSMLFKLWMAMEVIQMHQCNWSE